MELDELVPLMRQLELPVEVNTASYVNVDAQAQTCEELTDEGIVAIVREEESAQNAEVNQVEPAVDYDDGENEVVVPTFSEVAKALAVVRCFMQKKVESAKGHECLEVVESCILDVKLGTRQSQITDFFQLLA